MSAHTEPLHLSERKAAMTRIMYDSTNIGDIPSGAKMVAVYADGRYSATEAAARKRFPKATIVRITVGTQPGRHVCDCETGDATPAEAAKWAKAEIAAGRHPTIYCNASTWPSVRKEALLAGITGKVSYWIAQYDGKAAIPAGAVAKQYLGSPGDSPGHYDVSIVADYWPGVDPKPKPIPVAKEIPVHVRACGVVVRRWADKYADKGTHPLFAVGEARLSRWQTSLAAAVKHSKGLLK